MSKQTRNTLLLVLAAMIWGGAFTAQSLGAEVEPYTFLAGRSWLAVAFLLPLTAVLDARARRRGQASGWPATPQDKKNLYWGGFLCGTALFVASSAQQTGITISLSPAKAGFLTALYVVIVPLLGLLAGRRPPRHIWLCVALSVGGMYLLCMQDGFGSLELGDALLLFCGLLFAVHILTVNRWSPLNDGVKLSLVQFAVVSVWATLAALLFETPSLSAVMDNLGSILYCGILSSGVAYTLQIVGQKDLNPTIASLAMCLESVFGALFGWLVMNDVLTGRELAGCALMFGAVVLAQLPVDQWLRARGKNRNR